MLSEAGKINVARRITGKPFTCNKGCTNIIVRLKGDILMATFNKIFFNNAEHGIYPTLS
jgi:hypothetical protein